MNILNTIVYRYFMVFGVLLFSISHFVLLCFYARMFVFSCILLYHCIDVRLSHLNKDCLLTSNIVLCAFMVLNYFRP